MFERKILKGLLKNVIRADYTLIKIMLDQPKPIIFVKLNLNIKLHLLNLNIKRIKNK